MTSAKPTVVPTHPSPRELASDLQLQLFEQAAAARLIARLLANLHKPTAILSQSPTKYSTAS